jgi:thymidylate kinase
MVTVALIGADGAGKTTLARWLEQSGELPIKYLYMGINREASNHVLPTTRLVRAVKRALGGADQGGPPDPTRKTAKRKRGLKRVWSEAKGAARMANQLCEEWYRVSVARRFERQGFLVLYDRHFFADYWAHDVNGSGGARSYAQALHGRLLRRLPQPDRTILLDAPAEVLYARKREGTLEALDARRREYLDLCAELPGSAVVDASQPMEAVRAQVLDILRGLASPATATAERVPT